MLRLSPHRRAASLCLLAAALLLTPTTGVGQPPPRDKDLPVLHVLLAADTSDPGIGKSVQVDLNNTKRFLENSFAGKAVLDLKILQGVQFREQEVYNYYKKLKAGPNDTLLFCCFSHGGFDPEIGHYLEMEKEKFPKLGYKKLVRSDLRTWMSEKRARLAVLLTDVCNLYPEVEVRPVQELRADWDTVRCLFLAPRGLVDINSVSEGELAWGNDKEGGYFNSQLLRTLSQKFQTLDLDHDGFLHWHELLPVVQVRAQESYDRFRRGVLSNAIRVPADDQRQLEKQQFQTVRTYALPPLYRFGVRCVPGEKQGVRVGLVHSHTGAALAGLRSGDVILRVGDQPVNSPEELFRRLSDLHGTASIAVLRPVSREEVTVQVPLAPWPSIVSGEEG